MDRKIKFRGKRTDNGEWVYGYLINRDIIREPAKAFSIGTVGMSSVCELQCYAFRVLPQTVGQYTGEDDICENEIYEGDIIEYKRENYITKELVNERSIVEYGLGEFSPVFDIIIQSSVEDVNLVIVGNIHDNPELLTKED